MTRKKAAVLPSLSRRERQIMDVIYNAGRATAAQVQAGLPDAPSYSAVRALLRILEDKGHVRHEQDGAAYVYLPVVPAESARKSALQHLLTTFFGGSREEAVAALIDDAEMSKDELDRVAALIAQAKKEGR